MYEFTTPSVIRLVVSFRGVDSLIKTCERAAHIADMCFTTRVKLEILYNKAICYLQMKNVDLYICPTSFIISRVGDQLILLQ